MKFFQSDDTMLCWKAPFLKILKFAARKVYRRNDSPVDVEPEVEINVNINVCLFILISNLFNLSSSSHFAKCVTQRNFYQITVWRENIKTEQLVPTNREARNTTRHSAREPDRTFTAPVSYFAPTKWHLLEMNLKTSCYGIITRPAHYLFSPSGHSESLIVVSSIPLSCHHRTRMSFWTSRPAPHLQIPPQHPSWSPRLLHPSSSWSISISIHTPELRTRRSIPERDRRRNWNWTTCRFAPQRINGGMCGDDTEINY